MHYDCTNQAPYSDTATMMTTNSLVQLPYNHPSRELAFFLKTTGPTAPHRKPSKAERGPRRGGSAKRNVLGFLKVGEKKAAIPTELRDEGGLLGPVEGVEQKLTSAGMFLVHDSNLRVCC